MNWKLLGAATLGAAIIVAGIFVFRYLDRWQGPKPNILVISVCSLRPDALADMPRTREFFDQGSFQFPNAVNGLGWTALFSVTAPRLKTHFFDAMGYRLAGLWVKYQMYLIPMRNSWRKVSDEEKRRGLPPDSNFEKNYRESLDSFLKSLDHKNPLPYFVIAQLKYPHFPLIDRFNEDARWDQFLDDTEKRILKKYLENPTAYAEKIPFLLLLTNDPKVLKADSNIAAAMKNVQDEGGHDSAFLGLLTSPKLLAKWSASEGYAQDLAILKKIYRANAAYTDKIVGEILDHLKSSGQLENTVVIFTGDHGEMHMQHGFLTHGTTWYEEALRLPLMIRLPGQNFTSTIAEMTSFFTVTKSIRALVTGEVNLRNFKRKLRHRYLSNGLILRDCANTWRGLRDGNKWKYAVDNATGETYLYDLEHDPEESVNLASTQPRLVSELEQKYWTILPEYNDQMVNACEPWVGGRVKHTED